jgi:hypothetical protein
VARGGSHGCGASRIGEGALRLVDTVDVYGFTTGVVQVYIDGAWGTVCNQGFEQADAQVACKQLGFAHGAAISSLYDLELWDVRIQNAPEDVALPFALEYVGCSGSEARLVDCPVEYRIEDSYASFYNMYIGSCDITSKPFAAVACSNDTSKGAQGAS